jgi:hypothetical protein
MIKFKGKIITVYNVDDTVAWRAIKIPKLERRHCDMARFRNDARFSGLANSDLFTNLLAKQTRHLGDAIRLDRIPSGVTVDESGFLATVTIEL